MGVFLADFNGNDQDRFVSKEKIVPNSIYKKLQNFFSWYISTLFLNFLILY